MKILVTGGTGFIGSLLADRLAKEGHEIVSYDLKPSKTCESIIGDILDKNKVLSAVEASDYVFHLAAIADLNYARLHPHEAVKVNVGGTYNVANACAIYGVPLSFVSTCCVYGDTPEHPSNEESLCVPTEIYAATKLVGESIVKNIHQKCGLPYNILRFGTAYGPKMRSELAVYIFILQALTDIPLTIDGSGQQTRCYIYIDDLIEATIRVFKRQIKYETLNLTTEEEISVLDMVTMILEEVGKPESFKEVRHVPDRPGQTINEQIDISKAKRLLNWEPKTSFNEGLKKTLVFVKSL